MASLEIPSEMEVSPAEIMGKSSNEIVDSQQSMFDDTAGYHGNQTSRPFQGNDQYFMGTPCMINHFNISGYHGNPGIMGKRKGNVQHGNDLAPDLGMSIFSNQPISGFWDNIVDWVYHTTMH